MKNYSKISLLILFLGALHSNVFGMYSPHRTYLELKDKHVNALKPVILQKALAAYHTHPAIDHSALTERILNRPAESQAADVVLLSTADNGETFKATVIFDGYESLYAGVAMRPEELENILLKSPTKLPVIEHGN